MDVKLDQPPTNRFLGQRADVYIETSRKQDVLRVPLATLFVLSSRPGVLVVVDGRARWRPVKLGLRDRNFVEVVSGLTDRDTVIPAPGPACESLVTRGADGRNSARRAAPA